MDLNQPLRRDKLTDKYRLSFIQAVNRPIQKKPKPELPVEKTPEVIEVVGSPVQKEPKIEKVKAVPKSVKT